MGKENLSMKFHRKALVGIAAGALLLPAIAAASPLALKVDMQAKGLTMAAAGVGTIGLGAGSPDTSSGNNIG